MLVKTYIVLLMIFEKAEISKVWQFINVTIQNHLHLNALNLKKVINFDNIVSEYNN